MLLITAQPIRNLRTPASADMNKRGFLEQASPPPLPNPPPLSPFLPIPYPLPLSTPATQANEFTPFVMKSQFQTAASDTTKTTFHKADHFRKSPIAHPLLNREGGRRPRMPLFARSSCVLRFNCPEGA